MNTHVKLSKTHKSPLQYLLSDLITLFESTAALNESLPRCRCGEVDNLQDGWVAGSIIWYCPVCRADEDTR